MADLQYVSANQLTIDALKEKAVVLLVGAPVVYALCVNIPPLTWVFLIAYILIIFKTGQIKQAGARGENATLRRLSALPDSYTIFNQVLVPNAESKTGFNEIDFVVVGDNGVFIVEVKNNNGHIVGSETEPTWVAHKVGRKGGEYTSTLRNPIKQLKRQIHVLSQYLRENGHQHWLEGIVFFSNRGSELAIKGETSVPVLHVSGLPDYIQSHTPKSKRSDTFDVLNALAALKTEAGKASGSFSFLIKSWERVRFSWRYGFLGLIILGWSPQIAYLWQFPTHQTAKEVLENSARIDWGSYGIKINKGNRHIYTAKRKKTITDKDIDNELSVERSAWYRQMALIGFGMFSLFYAFKAFWGWRYMLISAASVFLLLKKDANPFEVFFLPMQWWHYYQDNFPNIFNYAFYHYTLLPTINVLIIVFILMQMYFTSED